MTDDKLTKRLKSQPMCEKCDKSYCISNSTFLVLTLPFGLMLELSNGYYVLTISRNIVTTSCLDKIGLHIVVRNKCCSKLHE